MQAYIELICRLKRAIIAMKGRSTAVAELLCSKTLWTGRVGRMKFMSVQLLRELMQICPDLARPLGRIRDAVGQALYSDYYAASDGSLELKQLPYFAVVHRLELEKRNLQQKYEDCQKQCAAHGVRSPLNADGAMPHCGSSAHVTEHFRVMVICRIMTNSLPAASHAFSHKLCSILIHMEAPAWGRGLHAGASAGACLAAGRVPAVH